jgi:hypothetical protein
MCSIIEGVMTIGILLNVLIAVAICVFSAIYTRAYLAATGTWYERLWTALKVSATLAWAAIVIVISKIMDVIDVVANQINAGAGDQIRAAVDPRYVSAVIVGIMLITVLARLRTLWNQASG